MNDDPQIPRGRMARFWFWVRFIEIRLRFVVLLVLTGLLVGYWENIQNYYERWQRNRASATAPPARAAEGAAEHAEHAPAAQAFEYFCPMHPFVVRDAAGKCPICGMDLARREKGAAVVLPEGATARVQVSPERVMQAGVKVEPVAWRNLVREVRSYGLVEPDERRQQRIIARFPGRIDELKVRSVGETIREGEVVARIYSPEFYALANEYLIAARAAKRAAGSEGESRARGLLELPRRRLLLAGYTEPQLRAIEQADRVDDHVTLEATAGGTVLERSVVEGDMVEAGSTLFTLADLSHLWLQTQVYESEADAVRVGMPAQVTFEAFPGRIFPARVGFIYPTVNTESRTVQVRLELDNDDGRLRPGMYARVTLRSAMGQVEPSTAAAVTQALTASLPTTRYWCPMHHEVQSAEPGTCPKCGGMELSKMTPEEIRLYAPRARQSHAAHEAAMAEGMTMPDGMAMADEATTGSAQWNWGWACPLHPEHLYAAAGTCPIADCGMKLLPVKTQGVLTVPEQAVIDTGTRKIVYTEFAEGIYDAHEVELGARCGAYYPVLKGLEAGQRIVAAGSFLIDAEARLNPQQTASSAPPPAHQH